MKTKGGGIGERSRSLWATYCFLVANWRKKGKITDFFSSNGKQLFGVKRNAMSTFPYYQNLRQPLISTSFMMFILDVLLLFSTDFQGFLSGMAMSVCQQSTKVS